MKYASIDIETTGLDLKRCEAIEIAIVVENTDRALDDARDVIRVLRKAYE